MRRIQHLDFYTTEVSCLSTEVYVLCQNLPDIFIHIFLFTYFYSHIFIHIFLSTYFYSHIFIHIFQSHIFIHIAVPLFRHWILNSMKLLQSRNAVDTRLLPCPLSLYLIKIKYLVEIIKLANLVFSIEEKHRLVKKCKTKQNVYSKYLPWNFI